MFQKCVQLIKFIYGSYYYIVRILKIHSRLKFLTCKNTFINESVLFTIEVPRSNFTLTLLAQHTYSCKILSHLTFPLTSVIFLRLKYIILCFIQHYSSARASSLLYLTIVFLIFWKIINLCF